MAVGTGGDQAFWTGELCSCHKVDWEKLNPRTSLWVGQWEEERPMQAGLGSEQTVAVRASIPQLRAGPHHIPAFFFPRSL